MPLEVRIEQDKYVAESQAQMLALIDRVMEELGNEGYEIVDGQRYYTANQVATLSMEDDCLVVSLKKPSGYGALIWWSWMHSARTGGIYDKVWVSDNPNPPTTDPELVSDPFVPSFHDPRNAIPIDDVRKALQEYCRVGDRPASISWAEGSTKGSRQE